MSARVVTAGSVRRRTSEIRRAALQLQRRLDGWHGAVRRGDVPDGWTLDDVVDQPAQRAYLLSLLDVIDGTSAQLRELLGG